MLGEFGGLNGREVKASNGVGLPEKEEKDFLNSEEESREIPGVGMLWNSDLSPGCLSQLSVPLPLLLVPVLISPPLLVFQDCKAVTI